MPIDTKPEEKILYGAELEAAVTDGLSTTSVSPFDVVGSLKGPKPGAKRKPRSSKPASAA